MWGRVQKATLLQHIRSLEAAEWKLPPCGEELTAHSVMKPLNPNYIAPPMHMLRNFLEILSSHVFLLFSYRTSMKTNTVGQQERYSPQCGEMVNSSPGETAAFTHLFKQRWASPFFQFCSSGTAPARFTPRRVVHSKSPTE